MVFKTDHFSLGWLNSTMHGTDSSERILSFSPLSLFPLSDFNSLRLFSSLEGESFTSERAAEPVVQLVCKGSG